MSFNFPYPGPVPPFTNVPINSDYYQPSQFFIQDISIGLETTITTTVNHNYVLGQLVRILIPLSTTTIGSKTISIPTCYELNEQTGNVIEIPAENQITLDLNSQFATPFATSTNTTQPQVVAVGDVNTGYLNSTGRVSSTTTIPGSFINISPL
jgi:hypothetical protein